MPPNAIQCLHDLVILVSPAPQLLLIAVAQGQARRYPPEMLAKEALVARSEAAVTFDLRTPRLR